MPVGLGGDRRVMIPRRLSLSLILAVSLRRWEAQQRSWKCACVLRSAEGIEFFLKVSAATSLPSALFVPRLELNKGTWGKGWCPLPLYTAAEIGMASPEVGLAEDRLTEHPLLRSSKPATLLCVRTAVPQ